MCRVREVLLETVVHAHAETIGPRVFQEHEPKRCKFNSTRRECRLSRWLRQFTLHPLDLFLSLCNAMDHLAMLDDDVVVLLKDVGEFVEKDLVSYGT